MDFQQPQGYMRPPPAPPQQPPQLADPYHHQAQRLPVPPPNLWYSSQFQYQHNSSPSPPPPPPPHAPPPRQQWAPPPPHSDHFAPPPPPYSTPSPYPTQHPLPHNLYSHPPLPPLPPRPPIPPPQIPQSYPQVNQDWGNANWGHHQSWDYQANTNEEVWAAKARAWAAAKAASDSQQAQHPYAAKDGNVAGDSTAVFFGQDSSISPLVHQQEVPSSYSSVTGDPAIGIDSVPAMPVDYTYSPPAEPAVIYPSVPGVLPSGPQVDPSATVPSPVPGHSAPIFGRMPGPSFQTTVSSISPPFGIGAGPELHPITAFSDACGVSGVSERPKKASVPNWLREEIIKKKPVIMNSAAEPPKDDAESIEDEGADKFYGKGDQADSKSIDSSRSTEDDDDDEDEVEAARTAAINQEIKRVLTEVLLKVTDELFDEIATKVLNEEDLGIEVDNNAAVSDHKAPTSAPVVPTSNASAKVLVPVRTKESNTYSTGEKSSLNSPGDVLGLGSYASDDEEVNEVKSSERPILSGNNLQQQTTSSIDVRSNGDLHEETKENHSALAPQVGEERASREPMQQKPQYSSKVESGIAEFVAQDGCDAPKSKETPSLKTVVKTEKPVENHLTQKSVIADSLGQETRNKSDKNDKHENGRNFGRKDHKIKELEMDKESAYERGNKSRNRHDERHAIAEKSNGQNDSKDREKEKGVKSAEKAKDSGSRRRSSPDYVKEDKKERQTERRSSAKDDSERKRERTRDDKREKPRYTNGGESSRQKRYRSSSVASKGRENKDSSVVSNASDSSDESSDNSKKKRHSRRQKSPSPSTVRSRKRQVSRSPHSKHSQHRHSSYSSLEITRGRRSRSRSRSPIRRKR